MKAFLLDLWHDLREKRLVPVAAALAVAVVAIPVVLLKGASGDPAAPAATAAAPGGPAPKPALAQQAERAASNLDVFSERDPFKPLAGSRKVDPAGDGAATVKETAPTEAGITGGTGTSPGSGSAPTSDGGSKPSKPKKGDRAGRDGARGEERDPGLLTYAVDVRFGKVGAPRTHHAVQPLEALPNARTPVVVFLGVTRGGSVLFLVDTKFAQAGEGVCKPTLETCTFLYLRDDGKHDEHVFTGPDGTEYGLRLLDTDRQTEEQAAKEARADRKRARRAVRAQRKRGKHAGRPYVRPLFFPGFGGG